MAVTLLKVVHAGVEGSAAEGKGEPERETAMAAVGESEMTNDSTGGRGRLLLLNLSAGRVISLNPVGSDGRVIAIDCQDPDGIAIDAAGGSRKSWTRRRLRHFSNARREARRPQLQ